MSIDQQPHLEPDKVKWLSRDELAEIKKTTEKDPKVEFRNKLEVMTPNEIYQRLGAMGEGLYDTLRRIPDVHYRPLWNESMRRESDERYGGDVVATLDVNGTPTITHVHKEGHGRSGAFGYQIETTANGEESDMFVSDLGLTSGESDRTAGQAAQDIETALVLFDLTQAAETAAAQSEEEAV